MAEHTSVAPCCPELIEDNHCDVINFSRVLTYPTTVPSRNGGQVMVEVVLRFKFSRCTLGLTLGDPVYSTTLLPGEKVRLSTTDRRSRFSFDSETKLSYRSEQISEEQYFMSATQKYMADAAAAQSGHASNSSSGSWDFHGDASGSIGIFSLSADASTNASGKHNSSSVADYLNQQKSHMESAAAQAVSATHKAHSVSVGEVSSRTHIQGESEDHFEASSREFSNANRCHAVTYMFYRLNKKQKVKFELLAIERRILDDNAPIGGVIENPVKTTVPIALVPQDVAATAVIKRNLTTNVNANSNATGMSSTDNLLLSSLNSSAMNVVRSAGIGLANVDFKAPLDSNTRERALQQVNAQLMAKNLIGKDGLLTKEIKQQMEFESEFSLPTAGIIVKGCLDDCDVCEPLLKERMQLENDLLRKQIELLEKSQEYRCCPVAAPITSCPSM